MTLGTQRLNFTLERVAGPSVEPLTLAQLKLHLRIDAGITAEDDEISALLTASREWVEEYTGRALVDQSWTLNVGDFVDPNVYRPPNIICGVMRLRLAGFQLYRSPVIAITSVASVDSNGVETAITSGYTLVDANTKWPRVIGLTTSGNYRISYRAGYVDRTGSPTGDVSTILQTYKTAMKLWVEAMFDRDPVMMPKLIEAATAIAKPERCNLQIA